MASREVDAVFGALADATRRAIFLSLAREGDASASSLSRRLPLAITRQGVTKHLAVLEGAGLVVRRRRGREVRFQPDAARIAEAMTWMAGIAAEWDARLADLARLAAEPETAPPRPGASTAGPTSEENARP